jgi:hypothetical protein
MMRSRGWATLPMPERERSILVARALESAGSDVSHADGDYGTRFLATAGVLNLLAALHAYEACARGEKSVMVSAAPIPLHFSHFSVAASLFALIIFVWPFGDPAGAEKNRSRGVKVCDVGRSAMFVLVGRICR